MGSQRSAGELGMPANARCRLTVPVHTFLRHLDALLAAPRDAHKFKPAQEHIGTKAKMLDETSSIDIWHSILARMRCPEAVRGCIMPLSAAMLQGL